MSDELVVLLAVFVIACPLVTTRVAWAFVNAARKPPSDDFLWAAAAVKVGIAVASALFALIAIHGLVYVWSDQTIRILPQGAFIVVLVAGMIVVAAGTLPMFRWLERNRRLRRQAHVHQRMTDKRPKVHRRATDIASPGSAVAADDELRAR